MIPRIYDQLEEFLLPGKALVIYGSRQVGKTTLLKSFLARTKLRYKLDSGDNIRVREVFGSEDADRISAYAEGYDLIAVDEANRIENIGMGLKMLMDIRSSLRVIATGSSSFELAGQVGEPLTGRKRTIVMFPISQMELARGRNRHELREDLPERLVLGSYPEVLTAGPRKEKIAVLQELVDSYLLKDILELERVKGSKVLLDLLRLLAFQIGGEVSLSELGGRLGLDCKTVGRYLDLLEKSFVVFELRGYSGNLRNEIRSKSKYFFFDNGVRNAVIANFNGMELRDDAGKLWENFLAAERLKTQAYAGIRSNNYFWRTWTGAEVDWVEEREGRLHGFEFKYSSAKAKIPKAFLEAYPSAKTEVVCRDNYGSFVGIA